MDYQQNLASEYGEGKTAEAIDKMLKRLDTDYIDLQRAIRYVRAHAEDYRIISGSIIPENPWARVPSAS